MGLPAVAAILLYTDDRLEMAARARRCIESQLGVEVEICEQNSTGLRISIGYLRNAAIAATSAPIVAHFDSDDWSHARRLAEQVALLEESGADAVGYSDLLFWRDPPGKAWLYTAPPRRCAGTTLCYRRSTWERVPFADLPRHPGDTGEDHQWLTDLRQCRMRFATMSSISPEPAMIAVIHGGNYNAVSYADALVTSVNWRRAVEWDGYCDQAMARNANTKFALAGVIPKSGV